MDGLERLRICGAAGEKKRAELWLRMGTGKREPTQFVRKSDDFPTQCVLRSGVEHQISSRFSAPILGSQFLPSFSMPAAPQMRSRSRPDGGGAGSAWRAERRESVVVRA